MSYIDEIRRKDINTIYDSVYFDCFIENNIIKSTNGKYVKVYKIEDINYRLSDIEGKISILKGYMELFNNFDNDIGLSLLLSCKKNLDEFYIEENNDDLQNIRSALNETIKDNIYQNGKCNVIKKYIVVDIKCRTNEEAIKRFRVIDDILSNQFFDIASASIVEQEYNNLIKMLYLFYNPDMERTYKNNIDSFSIDNIKKLNADVKDILLPKKMSVKKKHIIFNDIYERCLYLKRTNKTLQSSCINQIINDTRSLLTNEYDVTLCIKVRQIDRDKAIKLAKRELGNVEGDIYKMQARHSKKNFSIDLVPRSYKQRREEALYINDSLMKKDENLFSVSMYGVVKGNSFDDVENNTLKFVKKAKSSGLTFVVGTEMQEYIYNSVLPYGANETPYSLILDTESLCGFNIFHAVDIIEKDGDYYGKNRLTNNIIKYNIMHGDNYSQLILGMSGKGKSFIGKLQLLLRKLRTDYREAVLLDPMNEWSPVVKDIGGKVIDVKAAGDIRINLFDIDTAYGDNPLAEKEEFILSVCGLMLRKDLTAGQRTTVSIAVNNIYDKWNKERIEENVPTLEDFARELKKIIFSKKKYSDSKDDGNENIDNSINMLLDTNFINGTFVNNEDIELLKAIMYYSETSNCKIFRGKSTISINEKVLCFNLKDLGSDLKPLAMEVICDLIWLRICRTKDKKIPTDIIIDEFHLMFKDKATSSWMAKYWKMLRKHTGCPIGITQNPEDVLSTEDGRNVINNTAFSILLSLHERDRNLVKDIWKLTNEEIKYITDKKHGEGILIFGASKTIKNQTVIPFENEFKKSNYIYKLINTTYDEE